MAYDAARRQGTAYSTVHQGCWIRSPMLCSVTTMSAGGIRVAAYCGAWASVFTLNVGTVSRKEPRPASAAAPGAPYFQAGCQSPRASSVHRKQYAGMRIKAKYCGYFRELSPNTTIPAASQLNSSALPWAGSQLRTW